MFSILEAVPFSIFLAYIRSIDTSVPANWKGPFLAAGLAAAVVMGILVYRKNTMNRIFLGMNLYLATGALAFLTGMWWVNNMYDTLQASGVLLWVIGVGIATTLASPAGFLGVTSPDKRKARTYSAYFLAASVCAFLVSFGFRGTMLFSEIIPFMGLFMIQAALKARLSPEK